MLLGHDFSVLGWVWVWVHILQQELTFTTLTTDMDGELGEGLALFELILALILSQSRKAWLIKFIEAKSMVWTVFNEHHTIVVKKYFFEKFRRTNKSVFK